MEGHEGLDILGESSFQNYYVQLQAHIERCSLLYMEFWLQLTEDNPNYQKLNDIGDKIINSMRHVEENKEQCLKLNAQSVKVMRLYGKFITEVMNDKQGGRHFLEK